MTDHHGVLSANSSLGDATQMVHIGRQALYDRAGVVVGYELLFRDSTQFTGLLDCQARAASA